MNKIYLSLIACTLVTSGCSHIAPQLVDRSECDKFYNYPVHTTSQHDIGVYSLSTLGKVSIRSLRDDSGSVALDFSVLGGYPTKIVIKIDNQNKLWEFSNFTESDVSVSTTGHANQVTNTYYSQSTVIGHSTLIVPFNLIESLAKAKSYSIRIYTSAGFQDGESSSFSSLISASERFLSLIKIDPCKLKN